MQKEGFNDYRIPAGCAISGIFSKSGDKICGDKIIKSIELMHERSNGLGGGFAGYGIYPEYKDLFAFHIFYDNSNAREEQAFHNAIPMNAIGFLGLHVMTAGSKTSEVYVDIKDGNYILLKTTFWCLDLTQKIHTNVFIFSIR